jgi:hypothetical protein
MAAGACAIWPKDQIFRFLMGGLSREECVGVTSNFSVRHLGLRRKD